jgi:hypothetical protein
MPYSKLIAKEFALKIVVEKLGKPINQVAFAKKTNKNQRSNFLSVWQRWRCEGKNY